MRPTFTDVSVIQAAVAHDEAVGITVTPVRFHAVHARPEGEARVVLSRAALFFLPATAGVGSPEFGPRSHLTQTHQRQSDHPPYNARACWTHLHKLLFDFSLLRQGLSDCFMFYFMKSEALLCASSITITKIKT